MTITLGFKAFDPHELLCHFVALTSGQYERAGLQVELADITFIADAALPGHVYQASCGAALASALQGSDQKILLVAVDRPMFWIWSRRPLPGVAGLANGRLATFPAAAPPHHLANSLLQRAGLDLTRDITLLPARDDVARLGLLKSGSVEAAVISSAVAPARMAALGFNLVCCIGEDLRVPTTGLAVSQAQLERAPEEARALVAAHRRSLELIHADPELTAAVLRDWFDVDAGLSRDTAMAYRPFFTGDGRTSAAIAAGAMQLMSEALGLAAYPAWDEVYVEIPGTSA